MGGKVKLATHLFYKYIKLKQIYVAIKKKY